MDHFLKELYIIWKEFKMISDREEKFNIFAALHKVHDERRLHSRFISVLLQPKGKHGENHTFLNLFVSQIEGLEKFVVDDTTEVYPKEYDKKENNNIDILIITRQAKQCLIIENKIYAGDSNLSSGGQLERYIQHARDNEKIPLENIFVIYLTLDGHEPSNESIGEFKDFQNLFNYKYEDLILPWLAESLKGVVTKPFLRESIIQYKKLVEKMTGNSSSIEERLAYKNLIGKSEDNMRAAKTLIDNFKHVKWHTVYEFWTALQAEIESNSSLHLVKQFDKKEAGSDERSNCIDMITHGTFQISKQLCWMDFQFEDQIIIRIIFSAKFNNHFYFGIPEKGNKDQVTANNIASELINNCEEYTHNNWMLLFKVFEHDIKFNDFSREATFNLINDNFRQQLVSETCAEVIELVKRIKLLDKALISSSKQFGHNDLT